MAPEQGRVLDAPVVGSTVVANTTEGTTKVPLDSDAAITLTGKGESRPSLQVKLPEEVNTKNGAVSSDGTIVYDAADDQTSAAVQAFDDGSVRIHTIIPNANASERYTYDLGLPAGSTIAIAEDGSASFTAADGSWIGAAGAPWAKDADGTDVPTRFVAEGDKLVQVVDLTSVKSFPVVADPWLGRALISSVNVIRRDPRGLTVSVVPTAWMRVNGNNPLAVEPLWSEYKSKVATQYEGTQFRWQLGCHAQIAWAKSSWNLDTWNYRASYWDYIKHTCN